MTLKKVQITLLDDYLAEVRKAINNYECIFEPMLADGSPKLSSRMSLICRAASSLLFVRDSLSDLSEEVVCRLRRNDFFCCC